MEIFAQHTHEEGSYYKPTKKFWKFWHPNKDELKYFGISVKKLEDQTYQVWIPKGKLHGVEISDLLL